MDKEMRAFRALVVVLVAVVIGTAVVSWWHPNPNAAADVQLTNQLMLGTPRP